jgi:hypothetical protein
MPQWQRVWDQGCGAVILMPRNLQRGSSVDRFSNVYKKAPLWFYFYELRSTPENTLFFGFFKNRAEPPRIRTVQ